MKNVFVTDLDGTLLDDSGHLSIKSRKMILDLLNNGIAFTIASARSLDSIRAVIKDLPLKMPVIEFNGSYITDYHTGEKLMVNCIDNRMNAKIYSMIKAQNLSMIVTCHENDHDHLYYNGASLTEGAKNYIDFRLNNGDERLFDEDKLNKVLDKDIICFNVIDLEHKIRAIHDELIESFGDSLEVHMMRGTYSEEWFWLNVADPSGTKGSALKIFKEMYLNETDKLYVFGDNNNDLGMFKVADVSIAVANGVEPLKELASETIGYNYDDSVAKYITKKAGI